MALEQAARARGLAAVAIDLGEVGGELGKRRLDGERARVVRLGLVEPLLLLERLAEVYQRVDESWLALQSLAKGRFRQLELPCLAIGDAEGIQVVEIAAAELMRAQRVLQREGGIAGLQVLPSQIVAGLGVHHRL